MDVTAKIAELARDGQPIVASNDLLGRDPAVNHRKELRVDYLLDGKPGHATAHENETLTLPLPATAGQAPQWEIRIAADGTPVVTAWGDGQVELRTADGKSVARGCGGLARPQEISGAWQLNFPPNWGAPPSVTLDKLISWTDHPNAGVRYFSGTATYEKEIDIPAEPIDRRTRTLA